MRSYSRRDNSDIDNQLFKGVYARRRTTASGPMLVCQCNVITDKEIKEIVRSFLRQDPWEIIVPAKVYRALEQRCKCAGCVPNVVDVIIATTEEYHRELAALPPRPAEAKSLPRARRLKRAGGRYERRSPGHRAA
jgi:bacterioferritin-associated ferredoxin